MVDIDVTDEQSVNKGLEEAVALMGGVDVVVNNAGVGVLGMQEHFNNRGLAKSFQC